MAVRVNHPPGQQIDEHAHDWPCLSIYRMGFYSESFGEQHVTIDGPAVVLHPARGSHANRVGELGLETFSIEFDPQWLPQTSPRLSVVSRFWLGGPIYRCAAQLARVWTRQDASETTLSNLTGELIRTALAHPSEMNSPAWVSELVQVLQAEPSISAAALASRFSVHPVWLAHAYRTATGEGLREAALRRKVGIAVQLLRDGRAPLAEAAVAAGFCDQSHMNRVFRNLLGRTPLQIRQEHALIRTN